jgi:hypothetical protein
MRAPSIPLHARIGVERFCLFVPKTSARSAQLLVFIARQDMGSAMAETMSNRPRRPAGR